MKKRLLNVMLMAVLMMVGTATTWAQDVYSIAGAPTSLFGANWDPEATATEMTLNGETGLYEWSATDATLAAGDVQFKVVVNHSWAEAYPSSNYVLNISEDGKYDVLITFNAETKEVNASATKKGDVVITHVYSIAGNNTNLFGGTVWDAYNTATEMTLNNETGLYEWSKENVALADDVEFKVVMNHDWSNCWPSDNYVLFIDEQGNYDVTITFNLETKEVNATATKTGTAEEPELNTYTATFTTNAGWEKVYAYAWTTTDGQTTEFLGAWPGTELNAVDNVYTVTIQAAAAPEYIIFNAGGDVAKTADLAFEDGKAYEFTQTAEWVTLINQAKELAEQNGIAVGKLRVALADAMRITEPTEGQTDALQTAIDNYIAANADQEKDETAKVATNGWKNFNGGAAGVCATQFAPAITTYDGRNAQLAEVYETTVNTTGTIIYQDITGLTNGKYKVGFYGNAFYTSGRGFESDMEEGAEDVAYVFANEKQAFITAHIATSTTENDFRQFDVEVTDGTIKLGMGKAKAGTNWHTMQIYQLTWFTTAKEAFDAAQKELAAAIAEAKILEADETKTEGRREFKNALEQAELGIDSDWYNVAEIEGLTKDLKTAIENFKKANYYINFAAGEYYIIDAESGLMMAAGNDYGTRGIVSETGLDLILTPYEEARSVTIDSRVSNGGNNHFLGSNLYMDSSEWGWFLEYQGFGFYITNGEKYINFDYDNNLVLSDTPREWIIVTKQGVMETRMAELAEATAENPVDATFLLQNPNFNRNDQRVEAWVVSEDCTNKNLNGGNQVNNCAESYHSTFTIMQTVSGVPAGEYELTAQGFYRQDEYEGEEAPAAPQFFANGVNGDVPEKTGEENSMSDASASFTAGLYTIEPIRFTVEEDGMLYVGVYAAVATQWVIFDNFRLTYYGATIPNAITEVNKAENNQKAVYNLKGQQVMNAQKGLYIINGKKVVK